MNKATRLFDFSAGNAAIVIAAYLVLICLFSGLAATVQNPLPYLAITAVLALSFVALFWYFYRCSVELGSMNCAVASRSSPVRRWAARFFTTQDTAR